MAAKIESKNPEFFRELFDIVRIATGTITVRMRDHYGRSLFGSGIQIRERESSKSKGFSIYSRFALDLSHTFLWMDAESRNRSPSRVYGRFFNLLLRAF